MACPDPTAPSPSPETLRYSPSWLSRAIALPILALYSIGVLLDINSDSLRQAIVPNEMRGRVISIAGVLAWSAIPVGALIGGALVQRTGNVALVFGLVGALTLLISVCFFLFSPLGHAERYVPAVRAGGAGEPVAAEVERLASNGEGSQHLSLGGTLE